MGPRPHHGRACTCCPCSSAERTPTVSDLDTLCTDECVTETYTRLISIIAAHSPDTDPFEFDELDDVEDLVALQSILCLKDFDEDTYCVIHVEEGEDVCKASSDGDEDLDWSSNSCISHVCANRCYFKF